MNRKLLVLLALCAVGAIVAYRAIGWDFNWDLFLKSLSHMKPGWLAASVAITMVSYWLRAVRWRVLLARLKAISVGTLFSANLVGFSAIYTLGRAGEVVRPLWLTRQEGIAFSAAVATVVVERVLDMLLLISLFGTMLLMAEVPHAAPATLGMLKNAAWGSAGLAVAASIFLFVLRSHSIWIVGLVPIRKLASLIESFAQGLSSLQSGRTLGLVLLYSAALWITITLQFWFLLLGMDFAFSLPGAALVMVGAAIGSIAQVPGIGGGFQAGYFICMTALFQIPPEQALATSLLATVFCFGPTIAAGGIYMMARGISWRELKAPVRSPES